LDTYLTIAAATIGEYKEKGSKFIAYSYFVETEEAVKEKLDILKKEHFKATHHCYAYRLGTVGKRYRANDDGEPSGTAGRPILGQIDSFSLSNLLVVVVRYYGGTKLGTSGLITAYRTAAQEALLQAEIVEKVVESVFDIKLPYTLLSDAMQFLKMQEISILNTFYEAESVCLRVFVRNSLITLAESEIGSWKGVEMRAFVVEEGELD